MARWRGLEVGGRGVEKGAARGRASRAARPAARGRPARTRGRPGEVADHLRRVTGQIIAEPLQLVLAEKRSHEVALCPHDTALRRDPGTQGAEDRLIAGRQASVFVVRGLPLVARFRAPAIPQPPNAEMSPGPPPAFRRGPRSL